MSENNPKNIDELLQMFVSTDDMRAKFMKPWRERKCVYASEFHILIRVNGYLTDADYPEHNSDNTDKLFPKGLPNGIITLARLDKVLANAPLVDEMKIIGEDIECDECGGTGSVTWEYKHWQDIFRCPKCEGDGYMDIARQVATGRKVVDENAGVKIGSDIFRANLLKMIADAMKFFGCGEVSVTLGGKSATRFQLNDDVDIILMPTNQLCYFTEIPLFKIANQNHKPND